LAVVNRTLLVIGYGSLLSGYGLLSERRGGASRLIALDAFPVRLLNARRGLAKPTSHGRYLAMDLEPVEPAAPIVAATSYFRASSRHGGADAHSAFPATSANGIGHASAAAANGGGIGALGLVFDREAAPLIARREEYDADKLNELLDLADRGGMPLGAFLLTIARDAGFNLLAYRRALRQLIGYTSPGYIFHPVPMDDGRVAITAIGSGFDGSGDPMVESKRSRFGMAHLLTLKEALTLPAFDMDPDGQVGYYIECLLGGCHGLDVGDLVGGLVQERAADANPPEFSALTTRLAKTAMDERGRFLRATSLDEARYASAFSGESHPALASILRLQAA